MSEEELPARTVDTTTYSFTPSAKVLFSTLRGANKFNVVLSLHKTWNKVTELASLVPLASTTVFPVTLMLPKELGKP